MAKNLNTQSLRKDIDNRLLPMLYSIRKKKTKPQSAHLMQEEL